MPLERNFIIKKERGDDVRKDFKKRAQKQQDCNALNRLGYRQSWKGGENQELTTTEVDYGEKKEIQSEFFCGEGGELEGEGCRKQISRCGEIYSG